MKHDLGVASRFYTPSLGRGGGVRVFLAVCSTCSWMGNYTCNEKEAWAEVKQHEVDAAS